MIRSKRYLYTLFLHNYKAGAIRDTPLFVRVLLVQKLRLLQNGLLKRYYLQNKILT